MLRVHTVKKNLFSLASAELITKVIGAVLYMVLARYLGPSNFGIYSIAVSFVAIFALFANLGIDSFLIKEISRDSENIQSLLQNAVPLKLLGGTISFGVVAASIMFLPYDQVTRSAILLFSISIIFSPLNNLFDAIYRGTERMELSALMRVSRSLITVSIILVFIFLKQDVVLMTCSHPITSLLLLILFYSLSVRRSYYSFSFSFDFAASKKLLLNSLPFLTMGVIYIISAKTDIVMLSALSDTKNVGLYDAANQIVLILLIAPSLISQVLYPYMSRLYGKSEDGVSASVNLAIKILAFIGVPIACLLYFGAPFIITFFYGDEYALSFKILKVMSYGVSIVFIRSILSWVLVAVDKVNLMMKIGFINLMINIVINFLLIPSYGTTGAAVATVISMLITTISILVTLKKQFVEINSFLSIYFKPVIAGAIMSVAQKLLSDSNIIISSIVGLIAYLMIIFALKGFSKGELKIVQKFIFGSKINAPG